MVDGIVRIKPLVAAAKKLAMPAVAITDQNNLFAAVKFYRAATGAGIKPIIGADVLIANEQNPQQPFHLILLCQNQQGYHNLTALVSRAYLEGQHLGRAQLKPSWFTEELCEGLIALSGGLQGDVGQALAANNPEQAQQLLSQWHQLFPNRFYLELQRTNRPGEENYIHSAVKLATQNNLPVVATNAVRFIHADDVDAHEARVCIHDGYTLADTKRPRIYSAEQYLRSANEMVELFSDIPEALANTVEIAKRCNVELTLGEAYLPDFPIPQGQTIAEFLAEESQKGLQERLAVLFRDQPDQLAEHQQAYQARLALELDVINSMGFPGYFLIVADFIRWAKNNGIPVGPGRGSGAGSLVAYALNITDLDPLEYDLLFERFLNPERVSMPDFDVDFCMEGRDRVIDYVAQKYGREAVSQIITYGTMAAKAVVRDVGRVLGNPYGFVDKIAKLIPFELGITLEKALQQEEELEQRYHDEEEVKALIDLALKLEGITRNAGKHAGGVVIAPSKLTDFAPLYCEENGENLVTQFDKDDVEAVGLVKFDFLGLRTLTIIDWAIQTINQQRATEKLDPLDIALIPTVDEKSFELLKACQTTAVFQLESRGMKDLIKRLQPDCFEEIIALVALFRPGPLQSGMVDDFIDRKHGRAVVEYPHPDLEPILKPTYGVILYQEQVMQIAQVLAGYTLGGADLLRRAMGKKKPEEMAKQRSIFVEGAVARDVDKDTATHIFDLMEKFAGYGFNKSHSAAYALVAYQTAWLKAHYPAAFMSAVLSSDMDNTDKVVTFIEECAAMQIPVLPPDINHSELKFTVQQQENIRFGLAAIKGVGESAIESIIESRQQDAYKDLFDFCQRVDLRKVNRRVLEALIHAGAMDSLDCERSTLIASVDAALKAAEQTLTNQQRGQDDLFSSGDEQQSAMQIEYIEMPAWSAQQRLRGEKETLGFYLTGHPIDQYQQELGSLTSCPIEQLSADQEGLVTIAGLVTNIRTLITKRGNRMAIVSLSDGKCNLDVAAFSDVYDLHKDILHKDQLLLIEGEVSHDEYTDGLRMSAKRMMDICTARENYAKFILIKVPADHLNASVMDQFEEQLRPYSRGVCPVVIEYAQQHAQARLLLGKQWRLSPNDEALLRLQDIFGESQVTMQY